MQLSGATDGLHPDKAKRARDDCRCNIRRHWRRSHRSICQSRSHGYFHPVSAQPRFARAAAADDDIGGPNVHALAIEGNFDDCQSLVKGMFNDFAFRDSLSLSGVNSINWARIMPQIVYYFTSAVALGSPDRPYRSPFRPVILAIFLRAMLQSAWVFRSTDWSLQPMTTIF